MGEILETECKECKDNRCYFMGVGESCIDTLIKLAAKDYHFLGHSMTKDAFSRMDAIIQNLSSTPHIHEELEVQECAVSTRLILITMFILNMGREGISHPENRAKYAKAS